MTQERARESYGRAVQRELDREAEDLRGGMDEVLIGGVESEAAGSENT